MKKIPKLRKKAIALVLVALLGFSAAMPAFAEEKGAEESANLALGKTVIVAPTGMEDVTEEMKKNVTDVVRVPKLVTRVQSAW